MPLLDTLQSALAYVSRACGFETLDAFPAGHPYARTRWNPAYFDIASDLTPDEIERSLCESIANTPSIFAHIVNPTPRMQRALLAVIETRMRRSCGQPLDLVALLVQAYDSPHTLEVTPGLRRAIAECDGDARTILAFLHGQASAFGVIEG
ncbi:MAG: hypothetical protein ACLGI6_16325 [Gammaproteobacteria bacterium]